MGYFLFLSFVILTLVAIVLFNGELFSPSVLFGLGFIISSFCYVINFDNWNSKGEYLTFTILISGYLIMIIIEYFFSRLYRATISKNSYICYAYDRIEINKIALLVINLVCISISVAYYIGMMQLSARLGFGSVLNPTTVELIRRATMNGSISADEKLSSLLTQSYKFVAASAFFLLYIFVNNRVNRKRNEKKYYSDFIYLLVPIIYIIVQLFVGGNRLRGIRLFLAGLLFYYSSYCRKRKSIHGFNKKQYFTILIASFAVMLIFKLLTTFIGRGIGFGLVEYITTYLGSGIEMFNSHFIMQYKSIPKSKYFGSETFYFVWDFLRKLGLSDFSGKQQLEFHLVGALRSNVYTGFRKPIHDFGITGMVLCHSFMCIFYSALYVKHYKNSLFRSDTKHVWDILLYSYFCFGIFFYFFDNYFYQQFSLDAVVTLIFLYLLYFFLVRKKIRFVIG